jgi:hypothetical protein
MMNPIIAPISARPATPPTVPPTISATWFVGKDVAVDVEIAELVELVRPAGDEVGEIGDGKVVDVAAAAEGEEEEEEELVRVNGEEDKSMTVAEVEHQNEEYVPNLKVTHSGNSVDVLFFGCVSSFLGPAGRKTYQKPVPASHPFTAHEAALWAAL